MSIAIDTSRARVADWPRKLVLLFVASACITVPYFAGWTAPFRYHDDDHRMRLVLVAVLFVVQLAGMAWVVRSRIELAPPTGRVAWLCLGAYTLLSVFVGAVILQGFPNSADEWIFLFQADTYARGRLWNAVPPDQETGLFFLIHIFMRDGKWIGQYPPGWPVVLLPFRLLHVPAWVANVFLGTALLAVTARLATRLLPTTEAALATCAVALTPFIVFNNGSYFSHQLPAVSGVLFVLATIRFQRAPSWSASLAGGVCLGVIGIARYLDVLALATPFFVVLAWQIVRKPRTLTPALGFGLGALPFLLILFAYNQAVTGHALLAVTKWGYPTQAIAKLGFGPDHPLGEAILRTLTRQFEFVEWTMPVLIALWGVAFVVRVVRGRATWIDWIYPSFLVWYALSGVRGGERYGPRYYLPAYPFVVLTIALAISDAPTRGRWLRAGLVTCVPMAAALGIGWAIFTQQMIWERRQMEIAIERAGLSQVVVIVPSSIGTARPMQYWDLARNDPDLAQPVLFATDPVHYEFGAQTRLATLFPDRAIWRYVWDRPSRQGRLEKLSEPTGAERRSEGR
ncbi:hypothetical protein [Roseiterribacter gracilis]|uniref:Glycosyltransferase RgtA/B/C/D-like domain-containing protein n=1 Tax=Roseiterribacter gracilis TaxID=2812848 RepID=A0A8S8X8I2_9PROT|nr:hypothetical protein TMPK1_03780 [Rhodospirillales bacterium TMPK1]